ncbi:MAG: hypothetical protein P9E88_08765 [Candidatus Competibacter sp.]|nr:hypothetical protein [Candidatus Competibacter sp.]
MTSAERKAFAAEVGRICLKLREMSSKSDLSNLDKSWLMDIVEKTGQARSTVNNWWSAFCRETGLSITPRQASDEHRNAFFAWLDAQKQAAHRGIKSTRIKMKLTEKTVANKSFRCYTDNQC